MADTENPRIIAAGRVIAAERDLAPGAVEIEDGRIVRVRGGRPRRADVRVAGVLSPGLIDLQINGAAGVDFATCETAPDLVRVHGFLLSTGVTAYLPTLISSPLPRLREVLRRWAQWAGRRGAPRILGVHLEGPYLNPAFAGAHNPDDLRVPDAVEFAALLDGTSGVVRLLTIAPELPGADALIRAARRRRIAVAAGHTAATFEEATQGFAEGLRMVTHLFNAMRPLHHREPGIIGAALADKRIVVGLIADLVHVHPGAIRLALRLKGPDRVALVTDAIAVVGTGRRRTTLAGAAVTITDAPRLDSGTLAGSLLTLDQAIRNVVGLGIPLRDAVRMASEVPARVLRRRDLGRIAPGARADLVAFDRQLRVRAVYVGGRRAFSAGSAGIVARSTE